MLTKLSTAACVAGGFGVLFAGWPRYGAVDGWVLLLEFGRDREQQLVLHDRTAEPETFLRLAEWRVRR